MNRVEIAKTYIKHLADGNLEQLLSLFTSDVITPLSYCYLQITALKGTI